MGGEHFLSCYVSGLGLSGLVDLRHDQCVALWRRDAASVELVRYWELERFSGQKHHAWPLLDVTRTKALLEHLLSEEGLSLAEISEIWGIPGFGDPVPKPDVGDDIAMHSLAHLASAVLMDSELFQRETIVGLAMDGGPDFALESRSRRAWYCGCVSVRGAMTIVPIESPGLLYGAASHRIDQEPGTLMALAHATSCRVDGVDLETVLATLDLTGPEARASVTKLVDDLVEGAWSAHAAGAVVGLDERFTLEENLVGAVMKSVQWLSEEIALRTVRHLVQLGGVDPKASYLALAGGSALNCPTNTRLMDEFGFKGLLAPPCVNDSGQALGAGLVAFLARGDLDDRSYRFPGAFVGSRTVDLDGAIDRFAPSIDSIEEFDGERFAADVINGPVAWVEGAAEIGPRALGHRSLLADPRSPAAKDDLNRVKGRQWWRPVAPVVLEEAAPDWFDLSRPSPYMLEVAHVRAEREGQVPAVVHLDGTARLQTVPPSSASQVRVAIEMFSRATGVPMLCNTSLNDRGEPIVATADQAITFCRRKGLPVLYVDGRRLSLDVDLACEAHDVAGRCGELFDDGGAALARLWDELEAEGLTAEALFVLCMEPAARSLLTRGIGPLLDLLRFATDRDPRLLDEFELFRNDFGRGARFHAHQPRFRQRW